MPSYVQPPHLFRLVQFANAVPLILSDEYHIKKLLRCYINKMFKKKKEKVGSLMKFNLTYVIINYH